MWRIVILTWVSCSWKTSLQEELITKHWWARPLNFTTRKPRDKEALTKIDEEGDFCSKELDEYVFLTEDTFFKKLRNGDMLEYTNYMWKRYWVSSIIPKWKDVCIVLDPVGRNQVMEYYTRKGRSVETYYIEINKDKQIERLTNRWDNEKQILSRKKDFEWFSPTIKCKRLNGAKDTDVLASTILNLK